MRRQTELTEHMRTILVDWMIEVNLKFKLLTETVFLSVNILDKVLCNREVTRYVPHGPSPSPFRRKLNTITLPAAPSFSW
jgi:hypothetical protein